MDRITLMASDIKAVLHAIDDVALHHGRSLQPKEQKFLVDMDNRLRDQTKATLKIKQARWLTDILAQAPKRTARAKVRAQSNGVCRGQVR
jgi:predicted neutral ceramidase superfamily lipid hydrolase